MKKIETYISVDIEADGGYPGRYSMLSIGAVAAATYDGKTFTRLDLDKKENGFYRMLKPMTGNFDPQAVEVCEQGGVSRDEALISGYHPESAMDAFGSWLLEFDNPIMVAYPLGFDWSFVYYYFCNYGSPDKQPFGFSRHLDIKTLYAAKAGVPIYNAIKRHMPKKLHSTRPHTHNALDDAREQADLFCNIWEWEK